MNAPRLKYSELTGVIASEIGWMPPLRYLLRRARVLSLVDAWPSGNFLEIGCGAGALLCDFASRGFSVQGLETSPEALVKARQLAQITGSGHQIHAKPQAWTAGFDVICAFDVLEHIEDDSGALDEWMRWLVPDGKIVLSVPAHRARWGYGDIWAGHWRRYDREDIEELMRSQELEVLHFECYGFPLANFTEWIGNHIYRRMIKERGEQSKSAASALSGIDRRSYAGIGSLIASPLGRGMMSIFMAIQLAAKNRNWGSGYLLVARKR